MNAPYPSLPQHPLEQAHWQPVLQPTLESVLDLSHARKAWKKVKRNQGGPGIDGMAIREIDPCFDDFWATLTHRIHQGDFAPLPVRQAFIPKPDGGERELGIPTVLDRVLAQAVHMALAPVWEPTFSPYSFAYRPGRMAIQAVQTARQHIQLGSPWALHLDIKDFFGSVPHRDILDLLAQRLSDSRLVSLIDQLLKSGICEQALVRVSDIGITQGSPLSPLLANIVLNEFDSFLTENSLPFSRYADDSLVLFPSQEAAQEFLPRIESKLKDLGLTLNQDKTRSTPAQETDFLGFTFRPDASGRLLISISEKPLSRMKDTLASLTEGRWEADGPGTLAECATLLNSWRGYYGRTEVPNEFQALIRVAAHNLAVAFPADYPVEAEVLTLLANFTPPSSPGRGPTPDYGGQIPSPNSKLTNWPATLRLFWKRLPRQNYVRLRVNLGLKGKRSRGLFRTRSVSLIILGQEFRFSL